MQEKKNIRLLILLLVLIAATAVTLWINAKPDVVVNKNIFKVEDAKQIDRVLLESDSKLELKFNGTRWMINDKYEADRNLVGVLFATIQQAEPKRPVSASLKDSLTNVLQKNGVKVSLFAGSQEMQTFFAGGNVQKTQAYFEKEGESTPYVMIIPGYRVYVSGIFELDGNGWRDKRIFNFNWRNFKNLTASFPAKPAQNFKVTFIDKYFGIEGISEVDTTKLNNYLDAVSLLTADQFINSETAKKDYDSLLTSDPQLIIDVTDVAERHYHLSLYAVDKSKAYIPGKLQDDQLAIFKRKKLIEILREKAFFVRAK